MRRWLFMLFGVLILAAPQAMAQTPLNGVWRGTADIGDGQMGIDTTVVSVDGTEFSGYVDLYSIGKGFAGVVSCASFVGSYNPKSGQIALRTDPPPGVLTKTGGQPDGLRTLAMVGQIAGTSWTGRFDWLSIFKSFSMAKVRAPVVRKPHCRSQAADLSGRAAKSALMKERDDLNHAIEADNATAHELTNQSVAKECLLEAVTGVEPEDVKRSAMTKALQNQLSSLVASRWHVLADTADWAYEFYEANRSGEPFTLRAKIFGGGFACFANRTTEKLNTLFARRIVQEKRLAEIERELARH